METLKIEIVDSPNEVTLNYYISLFYTYLDILPTQTLVNFFYPFSEYQHIIKTIVSTSLACRALNIYEISLFLILMIAYYAMVTMKLWQVLNLSWMAVTMVTLIFHYKTNLVTSLTMTYTFVKLAAFFEFILDFLGIYASLVLLCKVLKIGRVSAVVSSLLGMFSFYLYSESTFSRLEALMMIVILTATVLIFYKVNGVIACWFYLMSIFAHVCLISFISMSNDENASIIEQLTKIRIRFRLPLS